MILHTDCSGQGQPLVLIHGLLGSLENLGMIARQLAVDFSVINLDQRNHGRSGRAEQMSYSLMADDVADTLDSLGLDQVALLGHSMGGKTAMQFALHYPHRVSHLIIADISPAASLARHQVILDALSALDLTKLTDRSHADKQLSVQIPDAGTRAFLLRSLVKEGDKFVWRFSLPDIQHNYPQILAANQSATPFSGPTLFIKGGDSDYLLPEHQNLIQQLFPAAKAKVILGTGHWLHAEKPAAFAKLCRDFLLS